MPKLMRQHLGIPIQLRRIGRSTAIHATHRMTIRVVAQLIQGRNAAPEGTKGHYDVRNAVLPLVHLADPSAVTEVTALIPDAPALRPADIYTESALPGGQAALDVGICSPDASGAGDDCCAAMWEKKRRHYGDHLEDMARRGLRYVPLVFSCYGRVHADSDTELERIAH